MSLITNGRESGIRPRQSPGQALIHGANQHDFGLIGQALQELGMKRPMQCDDIEAAIDRIHDGSVDLLITEFGGEPDRPLTAISTLRADPRLDDVACIGLVGEPTTRAAQRALELGIDDIWLKPLDQGVVRLRVHNSLERRRLRSEVSSYWVASALDDVGELAASVLEILPEPIIVLREDLTIELANEAAARLLGIASAELIGSPISSLVSIATDVQSKAPITAETLIGADHTTIYMTRSPAISGRPVQITAVPYERFGESMCACVLREIEWPVEPIIQGGNEQAPWTTDLWVEVANQALHRLDEVRRNVTTIRDQVFGPIGTAIYRSYLSDALSSLDQARHLLNPEVTPTRERRTPLRALVSFSEALDTAIDKCRACASWRHVDIESEVVPPDLTLRVPGERLVELLTAMLKFSIEASDTSDSISLRTQIVSEQRLLIMVDAGSAAVSPEYLAEVCAGQPTTEVENRPLAIAWNKARSTLRVMGGKLDIELDHPRGGFAVMAFLPQRRDGDIS